MEDQKENKKSLNSMLILPDLEPGVIDNAMLIRCILEYGPKDEAGRLIAEEGVHFDEALVVRLEFQHILRIDHLWMLTSLTKLTLAHNVIEKIENLEMLTGLNELDLSFNKIEKIENLDTLVNIEVLTLFHNKIKKLENMCKLEKLLVFSIGDNLIKDYKEMAYLRRFRKLRSVSFKGNPCCNDPLTYQFLRAALYRITYLDYNVVTAEQREDARIIFRHLLRTLDEADEIAEEQRLAKEKYDEQVTFYKSSFVEYLNGSELLATVFEKDPEGTLLFSFGGELIQFFEQYKEQYIETMSSLVEFALESYNDRQTEIALFRDLIDKALEESVKKSKAVLQEYEEKKIPLVDEMNRLVMKHTLKEATLEELESSITDVSEQFHLILADVWKKLMTFEMQLFEQCEESRVQFAVNMTDKINRLLEVSRTAFVAWREHEAVWSMRQSEALSKYLGNKMLLCDASPELFEVMMDRDKMMNAVAQSTENHMRFIDAREDVLTTRSKGWRNELVKNTTDDEVKRNRSRILEINYFMDNQRIEWADLQMRLNNPVDPEAVALLGEDFDTL